MIGDRFKNGYIMLMRDIRSFVNEILKYSLNILILKALKIVPGKNKFYVVFYILTKYRG